MTELDILIAMAGSFVTGVYYGIHIALKKDK